MSKTRLGLGVEIAFFKIYLFNFWLCWVFASVQGPSPVAASGGHSSSRCTGLSLLRPLLLRSTGSRCAGSAVVAHGLSRSTACGVLPDQGSNPCPLHQQADSQPLCHQGSPIDLLLMFGLLNKILFTFTGSLIYRSEILLYYAFVNCFSAQCC